MRRNWVVAGWVTAAAVAVAAGIGAVALAQGGTLAPPTEPMSEESVMRALEDAESSMTEEGSASPGQTPSESPGPDPETAAPPSGLVEEAPSGAVADGEVFSGRGGSFMASCEGGQVTLNWWSPAQGWHVSNVDQGPTDEAEIEFERGDDDDEHNITCANGVPVHEDDDDDD